MKETNLESMKTFKLIKHNTYESKTLEYDTGTLDINLRKTRNKRRTDTKNGTISNKTEKLKFG